ncbi:IPT/TIG domain-containing protein, partial [bacterium]|nr:IPT/TIG domain-containing protein [bacterium]
ASSTDFTVMFVPVVSGFSPSSGIEGTEVTVTGANFTGTTVVSFNGVSADTFMIDSDAQLRAEVPTAASTGKIVVTNSDGSGQSNDDFVIVQAPTIASFSPSGGPIASEVTITGTNFSLVSDVFFNGTSTGTFFIDSGTQIRAQVPAGATSGILSLTNIAGTAASASAFNVTFIPSVTSLTPLSGVIGTEVTLSGLNFTGVTDVDFNGVSATTFTVDADSILRADVPAGATTGRVGVTNADGTGQSAADFIIIEPPVIDSFSPSLGPVGTEVTILGTHFDTASEVQFNGLSAPGLAIDSDTQLRAIVPTGASSGLIRVMNPAGTGVSSTDFNVAAPPSKLVFNPTDDSFVRSTEPNKNYGDDDELRAKLSSTDYDSYLKFNVSGIVGSIVSAKIRLLVINGSSQGGDLYLVSNNYESTSVPWEEMGLIWNNAPTISGTPLSSIGSVAVGDTAEFDVASAVSADGIYSFAITNGVSDAAKYDPKEGNVAPRLEIELLTSPTPVITSFSPASAPEGTEVTINGTNLSGTTQVLFNGSAANFSVDSDAQLRADVPTGSSTGKISVTTVEGTAQSSNDFTVIQPPSVSSFTPESGSIGTEVTVSGAGFSGATDVLFNGLSASAFTLDSDTQLRAIVASGAGSGPVSVVNVAGTGNSNNDFILTFVPSVSSFTPTLAPIGTEVTISGINFSGTTDVSFNGVSASSFTLDSDTQIRAEVPTTATTGKISVTN